VAHALAACEDPTLVDDVELKFRDILFDYFVPGGRILAGAGTKGLTLQNYFVLPCPEDSRGGIFDSVKEMAETHSRGGGVGINLSSLRPRYAPVIGVNGISSGAISWGKMYNLSTGLIEQGGSRRGATMLMINDWHPDVEEFINAKHTPGEFENTNMSVCISDSFMAALNNDDDWDLVFPNTKDPEYDELWDGNLHYWRDVLGKEVILYKTMKAKEIWSQIVSSAHASAEPGLHYLERSNMMSNSHYFAPLVATNPCGEQPLEAYGVCTLGAMDLSKFADADMEFDWSKLRYVVENSVRFLDNVITINDYHFKSIEKNHRGNRRVGLGVMGLGELLIKMGLRYGSKDSLIFIDELFKTISFEAYKASIDLAKLKGEFKFFDAESYLRSGYMKGMPESIREKVKQYGIRNVCLLTVAPTGTTGTMMGTSTGIEPYFSWQYTRTSRLGTEIETVPVIDELGLDLKDLPDSCVTAMELVPEQHVAVQAAIQRWVDSAISKTTNCPTDFSIEDTDKLYRMAYDLGCKGITIYRDNSRDEQVLNQMVLDLEDEAVACRIDDPDCVTCAL
ncbi:MAG TPA: adenosylcobalamin-dependent ribonucleoside-diphosphate reductase, partial [Methylophaga sp.]|nr:adenosylcobalamin-dependent ribonucleoside-diphosphate reductase [Methylophaga sp.]